jgi:hypothetical protein
MAKVLFLAKTIEAVHLLRQSDCELPRDARTLLVLIDGSRHLKQLKMLAAFNGVQDFDAALDVLNEQGLVQELPEPSGDEIPIESPNEKVAEVNLLSLDFAIAPDALDTPRRPVTRAPAKVNTAPANADTALTVPASAPAKQAAVPATTAAPAPLSSAAAASRDTPELRARLEREVRERLVAELTPKVTEELRASLLPEVRTEVTKKIYEKLSSALRPLIELRLRQQLEPQVRASIENEWREKAVAAATGSEIAPTPEVVLDANAPTRSLPEPVAQVNTDATVH